MPKSAALKASGLSWEELAPYKSERRFLDGYALVASELAGVPDLNHCWMLTQVAETRNKEAAKNA